MLLLPQVPEQCSLIQDDIGVDQPALSPFGQSLTQEFQEFSVHTRIKVYSYKNVKRDKKLFQSVENVYKDEAAQMTPFEAIDKHASQKTLYFLIVTLDIAFPDYESSDVRPGHFDKEESGAAVINALSTTLAAAHWDGVSAPRMYSFYPPTSSDFVPEPKPTLSPVNSVLQSPMCTAPDRVWYPPVYLPLLDDVIGLSIEADPHTSNLSDDDEYPASDDDELTDEEVLFEFDDYNVNEAKSTLIPILPCSRSDGSLESGFMRRRRGAQLWSSHWFFLNRKQKRIFWGAEVIELGGYLFEEVFGLGGALGAGAHALGLTTSL
ncbi:Maf1-domain-containing protein [Desarmillaria ectypa]|nr:Maf1-domain-containing protein [Desarmillaria ectypa]